MKSTAKQVSLEVGSVVMAAAPSTTLQSKLLSGSLVLLTASVLVGAMNLLYNLVVARLLGPEGFSHATAVYTLLTLMSGITLSFQVVCAKLVASHKSVDARAAAYSGLHKRAWQLGLMIALLLVLGRNVITSYLNLPNSNLILILALGTAFYVPLGVRRGAIQGTYAFRNFGINLILEGLVRLGGAWLLIHLGLGVQGAVLAGSAGVILGYFAALTHLKPKTTFDQNIFASFREGMQATVFFAGQVVINNFDIVLAKHFFPSEEAGLYAAVALVGRVVNMCTWSVVNAMFPMSAGAKAADKEDRSILLTSVLMVLAILVGLIFILWMVPSFFWNAAFGSQFQISGYGSIPTLLILYATTSGIYSLSAVIIAYEMSRKIANTSWLQLAFGGLLVIGIYVFHASLWQMIFVQLVLMSALLAIVAVPVVWSSFMSSAGPLPETIGNIRKRHPVSEQEAIAEFLKNEFHHPEFDPYRAKIERLVSAPDLRNNDENALRQALLFLRRGAMWRELPKDTQWFEVDIANSDLSGIRVFPRAQWRKVSQGSFYLNDIVKQIRTESAEHPDDEFFAKLRRLSTEEKVNPTVLLIGINDKEPLTILDGNHRIASAMLVAPATVLKKFRFLCGFSPRMTECCWYQTNVMTLWRYAKNLVRYMPYDPESDIGRLLETEP
jgi:O-antigen/teichoic acid export membrane protein